MLVRLKTKLAEIVNGVDLSHQAEGDVIDLPETHARLLIAEHWAEEVDADADADTPRDRPWPASREVANDRNPRRRSRPKR